ncbi:unnamed protein product [Orchesella dallaii]|uniref:protein-tyrosine-phosphatase n=1 Tax=Orchesella dallaii TaxID=48710 RepID=A0ABP1QYJ7_9HEXA
MKGDAAGQGVVPLRTILRNILNLIDSFETRYKEGLDSYDQEFQELKQFSENLKTDPSYLCKEGEKGVNRKKNRYKDILPFDYTRVILGDYGDIPGSDYINANFIKGASGSSAYIACQGPLPHTVNDFWRMVVECEVQVIVMACNEQESGKHKCENYWVEEEGVEREFGQVTVWLKKSRQVCPDFLVRTMKIRYPNSKGEPEERSVCQFHYSAWPDHGVPLKVRPLLDMVRLIRDCQTSETLPVLVHCSAGCGRTGTICAIDYVWGLLRLGKLSPDFSLFNLVRDMRRQRIAMVQTKDQYILVHRAVRELFEEQLKIIDSHPYANVDINGLPLEIRAELEEPVYETVHFVNSPKPTEEESSSCKKMPKALPPPIPTSISDTSSSIAVLKHEKEAENHQRHLEQEKMKVVSSSGSGNSNVSKVACTPSPSSESQCEVSGSENVDAPDKERPEERQSSGRGSSSGKQGALPKSSLLRNPSIVKLKAFFEKSKDDKEKKSTPTLSRAKSDVSSSSRFYTNFAASFRGSKSPSRSKNVTPSGSTSKPTSPKEEFHEKSPVEKIKSKPALLSKPNLSVKRSKSLKIVRPVENVGDHGNLVPNSSLISEVPVPDSSKLVRSSTSSSTSQSSLSSHLESHAIKVCVKQVEIPKLQKPVSKSVKPESLKATTTHSSRKNSTEIRHDSSRSRSQDTRLASSSIKPEVPSKSHLVEKVKSPSNAGYGTTRIKIGITDDMKDTEKVVHSKMNGKIRKYGTVNPKNLSSITGGTLLTRSQSHVWQPSKTQVPVRIFSDENLSQIGTDDSFENVRPTEDRRQANQSYDEPDGIKLIRKQSLPLTKVFSSKIKALPVTSFASTEQPRSLTLTSHSSFLEARKRVPKTNPYANYTPGGDTQNYKEKSPSPPIPKAYPEKGSSPLTQFHFGENVPVLKNSGGIANVGNSSESSSNPGTPRNSLPGTPTQSIDVLYSPLSMNAPGNYTSSRGQSKSILKGSLSSTPSESDERLDSYRTHIPTSQSQVPTNITGPQKISSVRIAVGVRERRNSFRQAVWKEDQAPITTSIPVESDKSENIYITTTSSVPYFVKSTSMPMHQQTMAPNAGISYVAPPLGRPHRDYEPIWPDPNAVISTNPFTMGPTSTCSHLKGPINKTQAGHSLNTNPFLGDERSGGIRMQQSKMDPQVQDRMAEIKVLLEELRAPGKSEESKQRSSSKDHDVSHIPLRKSNGDVMSQSFSGNKLPSTSSQPTGLKHHRSLRAPSRPQYQQQGLSCFTFRKPSSFESITDQLHAEEMYMSANHVWEKDNSSSSTPSSSSEAVKNKMEILDETYQHQDRPGVSNHRLNEYVSLRACRSSGAAKSKIGSHPMEQHSDASLQSLRLTNNSSDSTPIPPPRSKRSGTLRRDQNDYANVSVAPTPFHPVKQGWSGKETNGISENSHHIGNGSVKMPSSFVAVRDKSCDMERRENHQQPNDQEFARLTSTSSIPLTNGNGNPTSPKAIIRALGMFQATAANVRSRFANWTENKERPGSKRNNYSRRERSMERGMQS